MAPSDPVSHQNPFPGDDGSTPKPLTDSKGWDGKLRHPSRDNSDHSPSADGRRAVVANPEALTDPDYSDPEAPSPPLLPADEDLLDEEPTDTTEIDLVHCRIGSIPSLNLSRFPDVERLCLRQNAISSIDFPQGFGDKLQEVDLYDNLIKHVVGLDQFAKNLQTLDLSFNKVNRIQGVGALQELTHLYFVSNRIQKIEGLDGLKKLKMLELAANRIRASLFPGKKMDRVVLMGAVNKSIENLDSLTSVDELWLAKNKITEIQVCGLENAVVYYADICQNLSHLTSLKLLSIQSNRLSSIEGLSTLANLEELHISHNAITQISGLGSNTQLRVLDISKNPISHLENLSHLRHLEELWASNCEISDFAEVERELRDKEELTTVYFEGNPLQLKGPAVYRNKVRLALPQVKQIDATFVKVT